MADHTPTMARLIGENCLTMTTPDLLALIRKHHPHVTIPEIQAELQRQAEENFEHAEELERYGATRHVPANEPQ